MSVNNGMLVSLEYTLKDEDGEIIESNVEAEPLVYEHGAEQIVPGLEKAVEEMSVGECKDVIIAPAEGYGELNQDAYLEIPLDKIPEEGRKVGARLEIKDPEGQIMFPVITELKQETVMLDFNHPLAGKTLYFSVKVVDVNKADDSP